MGYVPGPGGCTGKIRFPKLFFFYLLIYLLSTYLKVINPQISGFAAAIITKLYGVNASPVGSKFLEFG
mgnify:CR=1 FL=1